MRKTSHRRLVEGLAAAFLAAILLPAFAASQETEAPAPPARPGLERMRALEGLGLTPDQEKALEAFREARVKEREAFREEMSRLRAEMRELSRDPEANRAEIEALIDKTAGLRAERQKVSLRARAERDEIFTPEQLERMRAGRGARGMRGQGRLHGPGSVRGRMARLRALRHRPGFGCWIW